MLTLIPTFQLPLDFFRQALAQFDPPLVEAVDVPDGTFSERYMLIISDQSAQSGWGDLLSQNRRCRAITEESFVGKEVVGGAFGFDLFDGFANHEGFGLGEEVGGEHPKRSGRE